MSVRGTRGEPGVVMTGDDRAAERQPDEETAGAAEERESSPDRSPLCRAKSAMEDPKSARSQRRMGLGAVVAGLGEVVARQDRNMLINQLREITGILNTSLLKEALQASNDDIIEAVRILTAECVEPEDRVLVTKPCRPEGSVAVQGTHAADSPECETDYLQTAIALSLQDSANNPQEAKDSSRSTELYILENNKNRSKRKRCEVWGDNSNPNDMRRNGDWPVGLKNIGNTCWFNAVIQSLFHLTEFRRLVHSYRISPGMDRGRSRSENRNVTFMQELQYLFALMVGSNKKYVDPTPALELLKDAFRTEESQQQDISEFTHKLLDWLEDAFQLIASGETLQDKSENPMVKLFYGTFLSEGHLEDKAFSNSETFGQYPLQVNGFNNLNESLEGITVEGEIEHMLNGRAMQYWQERWFIKLPPVLTFELSRFVYNQSLGQPEKIHNKLEFPEIIYMDRFLFTNKSLIRKKREEIKKLTQDIDLLKQKLESYLKYGSGPSRCSLPDMLQYVLEFASTKSAARSHAVAVTVKAGPSDDADSCDTQPQENGPIDIRCHEQLDSDDSIVSSSTESSSSVPPQQGHLGATEAPAPRTITMEELRSVEVCLQRWRVEVEQDMQDLNNSIAKIRKTIEEVYRDPELLQVPYRLHAVLVHEGQANAGHYWAYIYSHARMCWLKYNDISVTEATWEELKRDSYGGVRNASAYCLMYINNKLPYLVEDIETGQLEDKIRSLPGGFTQWIKEENQGFEQEVSEWEDAHSYKIPQLEPSLTCEEDSLSDGSPLGEEYRSLSSTISPKDQTALAISKTADSYNKNGAEAALEEAFREEYSRLYQLSKEQPSQASDPRLQHVLVYLFQNKAPKRVIERSLLEQFADRNLSYDERSISIMKMAQAKLEEIGPNDMDMKDYQKWHEDYNQFLKVSVFLLTGLEMFQNEKYQESLTYLMYACQTNSTLLDIDPNRGLAEERLALYRRRCLLELNKKATKLFESEVSDQVREGIHLMNKVIIPCIQVISNKTTLEEDLVAIEEMRGSWCSYLSQSSDDDLQQKLSQFLPRLLDCSNEIVVLKEPPTIRPNSPYDLCNRFAVIMESIHGATPVKVTWESLETEKGGPPSP